MITKKQEKEYIEKGGVRCPVCSYEHIEGGQLDVNAGQVYQNIYCPNCNEEWTDEYTLTGITEAE